MRTHKRSRAPAPAPAPPIVVMGVSGSGKSTIGSRLAERLGLPYADADDFHPAGNVKKMSAGIPLTDEDRLPWLDAIAVWLAEHSDQGGVITCSALKLPYRDRLRESAPRLFLLHLDGPPELIAERMAARKGHYMPTSLLQSQFAELQPLHGDERGAVVPIDGTPEETLDRALSALPLGSAEEGDDRTTQEGREGKGGKKRSAQRGSAQ